jgi:hypothetical protein
MEMYCQKNDLDKSLTKKRKGLPSGELGTNGNLSICNIVLATSGKTSAHDGRNHSSLGTVGHDTASIGVGDRVVVVVEDGVGAASQVEHGAIEEAIISNGITGESWGDVELAILDVRVLVRVGAHVELVVSKASEVDFVGPVVQVERVKVVLEYGAVVGDLGEGLPREEDGETRATQAQEEEERPGDIVRDLDVRILLFEPWLFNVAVSILVADEGGTLEGNGLDGFLIVRALIERRGGLTDRRSSKGRVS